ncbi:flagellar assembly protein T N-terminal domain-containing protein [Desulfosarcina sp. OttesenSCG-928-B08]|nr:flagellar assembly protein T N-terminal domain-containing protein [Desulfosarcina sp. OttesenSCG-928-B08]
MKAFFFMPNRIVSLIAGLVLLTAVFHQEAGWAATGPAPLTVLGAATIQNKNMSEAKHTATDNALAAAVLCVVMETLPPATVTQQFQVINTAILDKYQQYVRNFRIVGEAVSGNTVRVLIQVDLATDQIAKDVAGLGLTGADQEPNDPVEVVISGISGQLAHFVRLRTTLSALPGVKDLKMQEMSGDQAILAIKYEGTAPSLADALRLRPFSGFSIIIAEVADTTIRIEIVEGEALPVAPADPENTSLP